MRQQSDNADKGENMKNNWFRKAISVMLAGALTVCLAATAAVPTTAFAEEAEGGKYVSDVFIAYGKNEAEASEWLKKNGWEPVKGDFNAGKASFFDDNAIQDQNVAAVMGIKRTDEASEAITDMAVMNMKGGYSLPNYEKLVNEKKAQIDEFINNFMVVIEEYRANFKKEGSAFGKKRADLAHDILNRFTDGGKDEPYSLNDTGKPLGDLLLKPTRQEGSNDGGDLQQLMLESSGPSMTLVEVLLALGADAGDQTWLERASGLTGDELSENLVNYVPEAAGQDLADSAAIQYLNQHFGDTATELADQWDSIHEQMTWYEGYNDEHDLWQQDGEDDSAYEERVDQYFENLVDSDSENGIVDRNRYSICGILYDNLYETPYVGDWGETLGDFFNPAGDNAYSRAPESFLPMAAALSDGQRAAMDFLSLQMLLLIGTGTDEGFKQVLPEVEKVFGDQETLSIYTGVNRAAFRGGAAITSEALMEQNAGKGQAFDKIWDNTGIVAISAYCAAAVGVIMMIAGGTMMAKGWDYMNRGQFWLMRAKCEVDAAERAANSAQKAFNRGAISQEALDKSVNKYNELNASYQKDYNATYTTEMGIAGRWVLGIGGAILIASAIVKGVQLYMYYDRDMTPIPRMIVDESDVVTYLTDDNGKPLLDDKGNQKKNIDFNTYEYYEAVKCNRPEVGEIGDWQDGVKEYNNKEHYCYDIADLNADMGQEWLALYTVKSKNKGYPVLADSLTLQYGSSKTPKGCTKGLHLFEYTNTVDLGDTAWAFNNDKKGVYFFWDADTKAFPAEETASAFSGGQLALAGLGGLLIGAIGAAFVLKPRKKEEEPEVA